RAATEFVTPLSVAALAGEKAYQDLFDLTDEAEMGHIQLSRAADLIVVAPATADLMAKMAGGHADDLASTVLMATDKPVLIAPAMNVRMWEHAATRRNLATLRGDGVHVVGPDDGDMACGEYGPGRMAEPEEILAAAERAAGGARAGRLAGRRALVTSGPTHEPIDPVRYIANRSSGKQGAAIAAALIAEGAEVAFVTGPTAEPPPDGATVVRVETAEEMLAAAEAALPADVAIFAAAVADWRAAEAAPSKMKKDGSGVIPDLRLAENPDILRTVAQLPPGRRPPLVVGFAAETDDVVAHAEAKRARKGCDWIVANDVSGDVMGGARNSVTVIDADGREDWPEAAKEEVARRLALRVADWLARETARC
ncbi:MAG: bifunctional phosphopantothenoylcysteine decarboxylase/phosphopantothenate--cysteine ligase CoaBC, partial [Pseudomonadota bacterium]